MPRRIPEVGERVWLLDDDGWEQCRLLGIRGTVYVDHENDLRDDGRIMMLRNPQGYQRDVYVRSLRWQWEQPEGCCFPLVTA